MASSSIASVTVSIGSGESNNASILKRKFVLRMASMITSDSWKAFTAGSDECMITGSQASEALMGGKSEKAVISCLHPSLNLIFRLPPSQYGDEAPGNQLMARRIFKMKCSFNKLWKHFIRLLSQSSIRAMIIF